MAPRLVIRRLPGAPYPIWEQVLLPLACTRDHVDVVHSMCNTAPLLLSRRVRRVLTIHDTIFMTTRGHRRQELSLYQRAGRAYRRYVVRRAARQAEEVITVSRTSAATIRRDLHVDPSKLHVVPGAADPRFRQLPAAQVRAALPAEVQPLGRFVLALGASDPRKNSVRVVEAMAAVHRARVPIPLVIVGGDERTNSSLREIAVRSGLASAVTLLSFVTDDQLVALYCAAEVLLYPSLDEGFGLPVLEAMACGTPVILTREGALPEVGGDAGLYVDGRDVRAMADAVVRVVRDSSLRRTLIAAGTHNASQYTWQLAAARIADIYNKL